jgi:hypothetical protein
VGWKRRISIHLIFTCVEYPPLKSGMEKEDIHPFDIYVGWVSSIEKWDGK